MKILLAPDKFKGSLSASEVCQALSKGIRRVNSNVAIISKPLADGGDGSLIVLDYYFQLETVTLIVNDPLFRPISASYKLAGDTAYVELASASGLVLLRPSERNCMHTSSYGTGELLLDAIQRGAKKIHLFIGGSATNDGGMGIAQALGYRFRDKEDNLLQPIGKHLGLVASIDADNLNFDPSTIEIDVICDVDNPFYGPNGAAYIYATQKGANPKEVALLDKGLKNFASIIQKTNLGEIDVIPGSGAAGGVGGGAIAFLNAQLKSGIQTFLDITNIEDTLKDCDLIITGEGRLDQQTEQGKVISGVCSLAKKYAKPIIAVCGAADLSTESDLGLSAIYTVIERSNSLEEAMKYAFQKLSEIGMVIGKSV